MHAKLHAGRDYKLNTYSIFGAGGIGKTQIALMYAHRHATSTRQQEDGYNHIFWMHADTKAKLMSDVDFYVKNNFAEGDISDPSKHRDAFLTWLHNNRGWLMIFDNYEKDNFEKETSVDNQATDLSAYMPRGQHSSVLLTSRHATLRGLAKDSEEIKAFTSDEGAEFISKRIPESASTVDPEIAKKASALFGGHPLALDQLTGCIESEEISLQEFLDIPQINALSFNTLDRLDNSTTNFNYERTFPTVFDRSLKALKEKEDSNAILFLELLVLLDADTVTQSWLHQAADKSISSLPKWMRSDPSWNDSMIWKQVVSSLRQRSLMRTDAKTKELSVHRMIGWAFRRNWTEEDWRRNFERATSLLTATFPQQVKGRAMTGPANLDQCRKTAPHVEALELRYREAVAQEIDVHADLEMAKLLANCGYYFSEREQYNEALRILDSAKGICEKTTAGKPHLTTALVYNNIARVHSYLNQVPLSLSHNEVVADIRAKLLDPDDDELANIWNNLAGDYFDDDQLKKAEEYYTKALKIFKGKEKKDPKSVDPELFANCRMNAGQNYIHMGRYVEANELLEDALSAQEKCLGDHYHTSATIYRLCHLRMCQARKAGANREILLQEAEQYISRSLEMRKKVINANDSRYGVALHKKAALFVTQEKYADGLPLLTEAIEIFQEKRGLCEPGLAIRSMLLKAFIQLNIANSGNDDKLRAEADTLRSSALKLKQEVHTPQMPDPAWTDVDAFDLLVQRAFR